MSLLTEISSFENFGKILKIVLFFSSKVNIQALHPKKLISHVSDQNNDIMHAVALRGLLEVKYVKSLAEAVPAIVRSLLADCVG